MRGSDVYQFTEELFAENMHLKRVESLARAVEGTLKAGSLGVCAIGQGLAAARHLDKKHAVKQVDRLMSNKKLDVDQLAPDWVGYVVGNKTEVVINMDWTEFDECNHSMLVMAAQTGQGRSTPLLWKTIKKSELTGKRNGVEDALIERLRELIPVEVKVTIVADRGFCDTKLYELLMELGFDFVIRFRSNILVENEKLERKKAREWVSKGGRPKVLRRAKVTGKGFEVPTVMLAWDKAMKSGWYLASSLKTAGATELKKLYGRRFSIEETFRDIKDMRFGLSMSWTPIRAPARRDRLFLLATITHALLSMLGQAGEALGFDRTLKVNTSKRRQYSLFRQGCIWMDFIPNMKEERLHPLLSKFGEILLESKLYGYLTAFEAASK